MKKVLSGNSDHCRIRIIFLAALTLNLNPLSLPTAPTPQAMAASRLPVRARHGIVASSNRVASQVGVNIMRRGGNAVDAAVATAFALAVTHPWAGNLGGGGFMLIRLHNGKTTAIDYRETAPGRATRNVYLNAQGKLIQGEGSSTVGYRAVGVPGTVAGMALAWKQYGSGNLTWSQLIEPARRLAAHGFYLSYGLAKVFHDHGQTLKLYSDSRNIFLKQGRFYAEGELLRQPDLAATLARLQKGGAREFYQGRTAHLIASAMQQHHGLINLADLRSYRAKERTPLHGSYRGYGIISMPPPSSGGAVLLEMLNILEGYNLRSMNPFSSERYHLLVETMKRAYADRAEYLGDTDFIKSPVRGIIDKAYAARQRRAINLQQATPSTQIGPNKPTRSARASSEAAETTHFTIVDKDGNAVSNTYTLNGYFGSGVVAKGTGVLLNNEMDDFAAKPGTPNSYGLIQNERNAIAPHKRPLSSMTPTFVLRKDGTLWFALGSPGGPTIINTVLQVIADVIDHGMDLQQAIDAPRIHHQWLPDEIVVEPYGIAADTRRALMARGHKFTLRPRYIGDVEAVMIEVKTGMRLGASDARSEGTAIGY